MICPVCGGKGFEHVSTKARGYALSGVDVEHDLYACINCGTVRIEEDARRKAAYFHEIKRQEAIKWELERICALCDEPCFADPNCEKYKTNYEQLMKEE